VELFTLIGSDIFFLHLRETGLIWIELNVVDVRADGCFVFVIVIIG